MAVMKAGLSLAIKGMLCLYCQVLCRTGVEDMLCKCVCVHVCIGAHVKASINISFDHDPAYFLFSTPLHFIF